MAEGNDEDRSSNASFLGTLEGTKSHMRFSEHYGIQRTDQDDWFDPHLTIDTKLFIDPLLMLEADGEWAEAQGELSDHFVYCANVVFPVPGGLYMIT
ncbi:hypothetical protein ACIO52_25715 [Nocardia sp. NPDC087230]|uniref:hypothetical protein n=1 Tax=Nocardia sp. NPDC087230 TaxID=3364331 RepID=UPI0038111E5C